MALIMRNNFTRIEKSVLKLIEEARQARYDKTIRGKIRKYINAKSSRK